MHKYRASTSHAARRHPRARLGARSCRLRRIADANGALLKDGLRSYEFDAASRLAAMTVGAVDSSPTTRYVHNALGQRLFKTEPQFPPAAGDEADPAFFASLLAFFSQLWGGNTGAANPSAGEKLGFQYFYDEDGSLLAEIGSGGAQSTGTSLYFYLPTPSGPMPIAAITNGTGYAVHTDHLNTPRRLALANKTVAWQWAFSAFGDEQPTTAKNRFVDLTTSASLGSTNVADVAFNLRYPGQYFDKESGLSYNYFRSYDSRSGRYTQADPIGLDGGWNKFGYAEGNPLMYTDPLGLWVFGDSLPQPVVDFGAGMGDTILFGQGQRVRDALGVDGGVDQCSDAYDNGEWAGIAGSLATGLAGGLRAAGAKGAGKEFSHWIPTRMGGPRSTWNGNFVSPQRHYYHDPFRYPRGWRDFGPKWNPAAQQFDRIPNVYKGAALGAGYGAAGAAMSGCSCKR
jgi:RHS repeat-associated protein